MPLHAAELASRVVLCIVRRSDARSRIEDATCYRVWQSWYADRRGVCGKSSNESRRWALTCIDGNGLVSRREPDDRPRGGPIPRDW